MKLVRKSYFENSICKKGGRIIVFYINIYIYIYIYLCRVTNCSPNPNGIGYGPNEPNTIKL